MKVLVTGSSGFDLTYIDDVVAAFMAELGDARPDFRVAEDLPSHTIALGDLADVRNKLVRTYSRRVIGSTHPRTRKRIDKSGYTDYVQRTVWRRP